MKEYLIEGKTAQLYTVGEMAKIIKRTTRMLKKWEVSGILPKAKYVHQSKRLYTMEQIDKVRLFIRYNKCKKGRIIPPDKKIQF